MEESLDAEVNAKKSSGISQIKKSATNLSLIPEELTPMNQMRVISEDGSEIIQSSSIEEPYRKKIQLSADNIKQTPE
jgi:hypothetical protein